MLPALPVPTARAVAGSSKVTLWVIPESFVHVTAVLAGIDNVVVPAVVTKFAAPMQNVLAGQVPPPPPPPPPPTVPMTVLPPPHETTPIDRISAPNTPEIFRILPPLTESSRRSVTGVVSSKPGMIGK